MNDPRALATDGVVVIGGEVVLLERTHPPETGFDHAAIVGDAL